MIRYADNVAIYGSEQMQCNAIHQMIYHYAAI